MSVSGYKRVRCIEIPRQWQRPGLDGSVEIVEPLSESILVQVHPLKVYNNSPLCLDSIVVLCVHRQTLAVLVFCLCGYNTDKPPGAQR